MRTYLIRRVLTFIPSMLVVYTLVFVLVHATPGNPWDTGDKPFPPQVLQNLAAKYHTDDPMWRQYVDYLWGIVTRLDFGPSFKRGVSANDVIAEFLPVSIQLGLVAFVFAFVVGILLGALSALRPRPDVVAATPRGHVFRVAVGPLGDPHHALVLGASALGVLVILLACAAAAWVLAHARRPRDA